MLHKPSRGLFVAGVDTEIGKTYVAALIVRQLVRQGKRVGVYKPAASGAEETDDGFIWRDPLTLWEAAGKPGGAEGLQRVCPQTFQAPLAPHLAARKEGRELDAEGLRSGLEAWSGECDIVIVEGAGGLMSPITDEEYIADLAYDFGYPTVIVAANRLGAINQTLQTLITAASFRDGIDICGVVVNESQPDSDASRSSNTAELRQRCGCPVLAEVGWNADEFSRAVDWWSLADGAKGDASQ